jgi:hypothetical protein
MSSSEWAMTFQSHLHSRGILNNEFTLKHDFSYGLNMLHKVPTLPRWAHHHQMHPHNALLLVLVIFISYPSSSLSFTLKQAQATDRL